MESDRCECPVLSRVTCSVQCPPPTNRTSNPTIRIFHCVFRDLIFFRSHYPLKSLSLSASAFSPLSHSLRADTNFDSNPWRRMASWICMLVPPVLMTCSFVSSFKNLTTGRVVDLPLLVSSNLVVAKIPTVSFLVPLRPC